MTRSKAKSATASRLDPTVQPAENPSRWFWPALLVVLLLGLLLRLAVLQEYWTRSPLAAHPASDALEYWQWAGRLAAGQGGGSEPFFSAPLYPYLLGMLRALGCGLPGVYVLQIFVDVATGLLLATVGRARFGPLAGILAALLWILMLEPASFALRILPSAMQGLIVAGLLLALIAVQTRATLTRSIAAGLLTGLFALSYAPAMAAVPIVAVWITWLATHAHHATHHPETRSRRKSALRLGIAALVAGVLPIVPATIHNFRACGEFIPISAQAGVTFAQGNSPKAKGVYCEVAGVRASRDLQNADVMRGYQSETGQPPSWNGANRHFLHKGLAYWKGAPLDAAGLLLRKGYWFVTGRHYADIYQPTTEMVEGLTKRFRLLPIQPAWLIPLGLLGFVFVGRRPIRHLPELLLVLLPLAVVLAFFYSPRYRFPALPVLTVLAAGMLVAVVQWRTRRGWAVAGVGAIVIALALGPINEVIGFDTLAERRSIFWSAAAETMRLNNRPAEAEAAFQRGLGFWPDNPAGQAGYARLLLSRNRPVEAETHMRRSLQVDPDCAPCYAELGQALALQGRRDDAVRNTEEALRRDPAQLTAWQQLAALRFAGQDIPGGIAALREGVRLAPDDVDMVNDLAWYLATWPGLDAAARVEARDLMERITTVAHAQVPGLLDTLAAATAATGDYARAAQVAQRAIDLATQAGEGELAERIRARRVLYQSGRPYTMPTGAP